MSYFEVAVAVPAAATNFDDWNALKRAVASLMNPYRNNDNNIEGEWTWYSIGVKGIHPYAYIDMDGKWHSQLDRNKIVSDGELGCLMPLDEWEREVIAWYQKIYRTGYVVVGVRCKG